jgi:hypothetical protein
MLETLCAKIIDETQDFRFHFFRCDLTAYGPSLSTCVNRMHTVLSLSRALPRSSALQRILTWQFDHHSGIISINPRTLLAHSWETPTCSFAHFVVAGFHSGTPARTRALGVCAPAPLCRQSWLLASFLLSISPRDGPPLISSVWIAWGYHCLVSSDLYRPATLMMIVLLLFLQKQNLGCPVSSTPLLVRTDRALECALPWRE